MTSCVSTFAILSPRGDTIISRQYRDDTGSVHSTSEIFFRASKFGLSEAKKEDSAVGSATTGDETPPVFNIDGISYISLKTSGLYFVTTTRYNVSPTVILELLSRLAKSCRDFCGILTEESIRKNFVLVYEVLDEVLDYGYPLQTSTEILKNMIYNEPIVVNPVAASFKVPTPGSSLSGGSSSKARMAPSSSVNKSVLTTGKSNTLGAMGLQRFAGQTSTTRNEIFVDILERVTCLFNSSGVLLNAEVDGSIIMKSFLINNPELRVALNEDLVIGKHNLANVYAAGVVLDDCSFHECVRLDEFEEHKSLVFIPPEGEFTLMNYRLTSEVRPPFRISPAFESISGTQVDLLVRVRADIPQRNYGSNVKVRFPVPKNTSGVSLITGKGADSAGQTAEYLPQDHRCEWTIKKFVGQTEHVIKARVTLKDSTLPPQMLRREMGPISMDFEIPMLSTSNLQVRYLRVAQQSSRYDGSNAPHRWVRYITNSNSYACRL
jgi:AP-4 complex subunit mu-1